MKASILSSYEVLDFFGYVEQVQAREQYASLVGGLSVISDFELDNLQQTNIQNAQLHLSVGQSPSMLVSHPYGTSRSTAVSPVRAGSVKFNQAFTMNAPSLSTPIQIAVKDASNTSANVRFSLNLQDLMSSGEGESYFTLAPCGIAHQEGWATLDSTIIPKLRVRVNFKRGGTLRRQ
jgi:hypothetical protein